MSLSKLIAPSFLLLNDDYLTIPQDWSCFFLNGRHIATEKASSDQMGKKINEKLGASKKAVSIKYQPDDSDFRFKFIL